MKTNDLKAMHFNPETTSYKVLIEFYTEPNKKSKISRYALKYALKEFKNGAIVLSSVYNISVKHYTNLGYAIKAGQRVFKFYNNCEVSIIGIDRKGFTTNCVKLENLQ